MLLAFLSVRLFCIHFDIFQFSAVFVDESVTEMKVQTVKCSYRDQENYKSWRISCLSYLCLSAASTRSGFCFCFVFDGDSQLPYPSFLVSSPGGANLASDCHFYGEQKLGREYFALDNWAQAICNVAHLMNQELCYDAAIWF